MKYTILLFLLVGCAPLTEDEMLEREYKYAMEFESYLVRKQACAENDGIWVQKFQSSRRRKPNIHDMRSAGCMRRDDFRREMNRMLGGGW